MDGIKYLELWQIRGLSELGAISHLPGLQNLRRLKDLSALEWAPALGEFMLQEGENLQPEQQLPALRNRTLRRAAAHFGSDKRNMQFEELRRRHEIERFDGAPFHYR